MLGNIKSLAKRARPIYRLYCRYRGVRLHSPEYNNRNNLEFLGSEYGGWGLDTRMIDKDSIIYGIGVGEDLTFDLALISRVGCNVFAFDPTPIAVQWVARQDLPEQLKFYPIGIASADGEVTFQIPPVEGWHSYSLTAEKDAGIHGEVSCPVKRLASLMAMLGHQKIDVLKMDIEGFEYQVIDDVIASNIRPRQFLIEFHHLMYSHAQADTIAAVQKLRDYGYKIQWISDLGREYNFIDSRN